MIDLNSIQEEWEWLQLTGKLLSPAVPLLTGLAIGVAIFLSGMLTALVARGVAYILLLGSLLCLFQVISREDVRWIKGLIRKKWPTFVGHFIYKAFKTSNRNSQVRFVEAISSFSRLVWISFIFGPMETQSKPGSFSLSRPHSRPAWMATTSGFLPYRSVYTRTIVSRNAESFLYSQAGYSPRIMHSLS